MSKSTAVKAGLAIIMFVMGNLQAWDSDVPAAGLWIVFLVSLAIALPPVALLVPLKQSYFLGAFILSLVLLVLVRVISPTPLPGLFIVLIPAMTGLIFTGVFKLNGENTEEN
jgi:hypothetical protein